jgi:hypothetical protein
VDFWKQASAAWTVAVSAGQIPEPEVLKAVRALGVPDENHILMGILNP